MSASPSFIEQVTVRGRNTPNRSSLHLADLVLLASFGLWAVGVSQTDAGPVTPYGLLAKLSPAFYCGIALLVLSTAIELARERPSRRRMSLHVIVLTIMLYGTAPLVYAQARYAWLYKTIGVVQYINSQGHLNHNIDIYQNWPGFFALAAWFDKVAGVQSPIIYAKWAQLAFELAALPLLYLCYSALSLSERQRWVALLLYCGSNWIGQDYFSPQAMGTLFCLGIMAILLRWLYLGNSEGMPRLNPVFHSGFFDQARNYASSATSETTVAFSALLVGIYFVLTFTHELSPYILAIQLGGLATARLLRQRWLPILLAAIAIGYMLPRFSYINAHYGLLNSVGNFFSNVAGPQHTGSTAKTEQLIQHCSELLSFIIWGLAIVGAWTRRRSGRTVLALVILAFSPILILALQAYGQEGILRVYLFSLPWAAALAASAVAPIHVRSAEVSGQHRQSRVDNGANLLIGPVRNVIRVPVVLGTVLVLFLLSFYGDDSFNVMSSTEVSIVSSFLQHAVPGPIYCAINNAPLADTANYNLFPLIDIFGNPSLLGTDSATSDIVNIIESKSLTDTNGKEPIYIIITPSMIAYNNAYGVTPSSSFTVLLSTLAHSPAWELVADRSGTVIYELPPVSFVP